MSDPDSSPTPDRRTRRTRKLVQHALHTLMAKGRYDAITVQSIVEQADVGRSTFYAHWQDKEDLLVQNFEEVLEEFGTATVGEPLLPVAALFRHVQEQYHFYDSLEGGQGLTIIKKRMMTHFTERVMVRLTMLLPPGRTPTLPISILATYIGGTLLTLMEWWLARKMPHSPDQMQSMFYQLVQPTIHAVLTGEDEA
jgi:AcrR family transcriptional regulator